MAVSKKIYRVTLSVLHSCGTLHEHWRQLHAEFGTADRAASHAAGLVDVLMPGADPVAEREAESAHWYLLTNGRERASAENSSRTIRVEVNRVAVSRG